jgi:hypothetical protein
MPTISKIDPSYPHIILITAQDNMQRLEAVCARMNRAKKSKTMTNERVIFRAVKDPSLFLSLSISLRIVAHISRGGFLQNTHEPSYSMPTKISINKA